MASILLLCQISIMTSHPVVNEGEGRQNVFYRDNDWKQANGSVIREENPLQRNAGSSGRKNGTLDTSLSMLTAFARMVRSPNCIKSRAFLPCGNHGVWTVICRKDSLGCNPSNGDCKPERSAFTCKGELKFYVSDCHCS